MTRPVSVAPRWVSTVQTMTGQPPAVVGLAALRPDRFATRPDRDLTVDALRLYNDIYATA